MTGTILFALLLSQATEPRSFEVASVRIHPEAPHIINITTSGPGFKADAEMLGGLVMYAYNLKNYQLSYASKLAFDDVYFDIVAKAEGDAAPNKNEFRQMVQSLLADRFKLKVHREMREMPIYALVVGKNGPKFKESAPDASGFGNVSVKGRNQIFKMAKATMANVADSLQIYTGRPVIDKTGLTGDYNISFEATPQFRMNRNPDPSDIDVREAVQDQLGLKLEAQKAMIEVIVVDHAELPSGN